MEANQSEAPLRLLLGGEANGLYVTIAGTLDTATRSGYLSIQHDGGWSPFPAGTWLANTFALPQCSGSLDVNGVANTIAVDCNVTFMQGITLFP